MMRVLLAAVLVGSLAWGSAVAAEAEAVTPVETARVVAPRPDKYKSPIAEATPQDVVQSLYATLLRVMQQGASLGFQARYDVLKPVVERAFDLPLMTRFASGTGWLKSDAVQQQKLINSFTDFSIATYASRFKDFDQEEFRILGEKPAAGGGVIVETHLVPQGSAPITLNYLLRQNKQGEWRINDVYLDATISEMAVRRSEFGAVLRDDGVDALIGSITEKAQAMRNL